MKLWLGCRMTNLDDQSWFFVIKFGNNIFFINDTNPILQGDISDWLSVYSQENFFQFIGNIYVFKRGPIKGNPLSPLLAGIFMDQIHKHLFNNNVP